MHTATTSPSVPATGAPSRGARIVLTRPAHGNHRPRRLLHPDEHGLAADVARGHPQQEISRSGANVEYNGDGSARYMPAGVRVLEASLLRALSGRRHRLLLSRRPRQVHRARHAHRRRLRRTTRSASRSPRGVYTSIFGSVETADQLALLAGAVRGDQGQPATAGTSRSSSAARAAGRSRRPIPGTTSSVDCVVEGRSESARRLKLFDKALRGEDLPKQIDVAHPKDRERDPVPRQAHDVRRRRDDDRLRPALPVLRARSQSADRHARRTRSWRPCARTSATATSRSRWPPRTCSSGARCTRARRSTSRTARRCVDLYRSVVRHARRRAARAEPLDDRAGRRRSDA